MSGYSRDVGPFSVGFCRGTFWGGFVGGLLMVFLGIATDSTTTVVFGVASFVTGWAMLWASDDWKPKP